MIQLFLQARENIFGSCVVQKSLSENERNLLGGLNPLILDSCFLPDMNTKTVLRGRSDSIMDMI